jgi:signal transduction histidine kinase
MRRRAPRLDRMGLSEPDPVVMMGRPDARLERLFGDGATAFRAAFDLVPDPVGVLWAIRDAGGAIADFETGYSNPAMARMIGVPTEASMGRRLLEEAPGFGEDEAFTRMRGVLDSGRAEVVEVAVSSGDGPIGRVRGVFLHRAIPFGADGVLNLVTDVTEQRQMEDELRNYAKVAAHDLREPIMAAGYFLQLLDRRLADGRTPENDELLQRVRQTHARARSLIDGILEYARSGTSLAAEHLDTGVLVADVAASLANTVAQLGGRIEIAELPVVVGDRGQLGRVFQNLVANALKFHSDKPPRVAVSAERHETTWLFSVRDNGVGVPPDLHDEIFSMFKRAHGDEVQGCGIGLAVCRKIVEAHGGTIWAQPAAGTGTAMRFTLPAN